MARLKPFDLLRRCRSESSVNSFVSLVGDQYRPYEYGAHGHGPNDDNYDGSNDNSDGPNDNYDSPNEDFTGNANADHAGGVESDIQVPLPTFGEMLDHYIVLARRMAFRLSLNDDFPDPSSSWGSLAGTATVHPQYVVVHYIVFWRNGFTVNDGSLRELDPSDHFFRCLRSNIVPAEFAPSDRSTDRYGQYTYRFILRNENHPADPARLNTGIEVDETRPTTSLQLWFSDHTREDVRFNLHHTVADIRTYFDASRPLENELYILLVVLPPNRYRELRNPDETIQQAGLDYSIIEQSRY